MAMAKMVSDDPKGLGHVKIEGFNFSLPTQPKARSATDHNPFMLLPPSDPVIQKTIKDNAALVASRNLIDTDTRYIDIKNMSGLGLLVLLEGISGKKLNVSHLAFNSSKLFVEVSSAGLNGYEQSVGSIFAAQNTLFLSTSKALSQCITANSAKLTHIDLSSTGISRGNWGMLGEALIQCANLKYLDLSGNNLLQDPHSSAGYVSWPNSVGTPARQGELSARRDDPKHSHKGDPNILPATANLLKPLINLMTMPSSLNYLSITDLCDGELGHILRIAEKTSCVKDLNLGKNTLNQLDYMFLVRFIEHNPNIHKIWVNFGRQHKDIIGVLCDALEINTKVTIVLPTSTLTYSDKLKALFEERKWDKTMLHKMLVKTTGCIKDLCKMIESYLSAEDIDQMLHYVNTSKDNQFSTIHEDASCVVHDAIIAPEIVAAGIVEESAAAEG